jgi:hypothetical protein
MNTRNPDEYFEKELNVYGPREKSNSALIDGLEPCPFCGTTQIQRLANHSNPVHDMARCRHCKSTARVDVWNTRSPAKIFPL